MNVNDFFKNVSFYYFQTTYGWRFDSSMGNYRGDISDFIPFSFDHDTLHSISRSFNNDFKLLTKDEYILELRQNIILLNKLKKAYDDN